MPRKRFNSRILRQLAEELVEKTAEQQFLSQEQRDELTTSLVRQWITYDGNATLFVAEHQFYLVLSKTPLGKPFINPEPALAGWMRQLTQDWRIAADDLPAVIDQLNRGQSAEVINSDGTPLRLWVNPKERGRGVEPLVEEKFSPDIKRNYRKMAADSIEPLLGEALDQDELDALACSVASQWQRYDGSAALFLEDDQLVFTLKELGEGKCRVDAQQFKVSIEPVLRSHGFSPEVIPEVIVRINLGQEIEFQDSQGVHLHLWHDPKARRFCIQPLDRPAQRPRAVASPVFCPQCTAVLKPWAEDERQQNCPMCGCNVSIY